MQESTKAVTGEGTAPRVTLAKGGTGERKVKISKVEIHDLWHIAHHVSEIGFPDKAKQILEVWHLAHDLKRELLERLS
jgi:hypothetical protein